MIWVRRLLRVEEEKFFFYFALGILPILFLIYFLYKKVFVRKVSPIEYGEELWRFRERRSIGRTIITVFFYIFALVGFLFLLNYLKFSQMEIIVLTLLLVFFLAFFFFYIGDPGEFVLYKKGLVLNDTFYDWSNVISLEVRYEYLFIPEKNMQLELKNRANENIYKTIFQIDFEKCYELFSIYIKNQY